MIKKNWFIAFFAIAVFLHAEAQVPRNAIYFELMGPGIILSLNYERYHYIGEKSHLGFNFGVGINGNKSDIYKPYVPVTLTYNLGARKNFLETGIGYTFSAVENEGATHIVIGYKKMVANSLMLKFRFSPFLVRSEDDYKIRPWIGLGILGYAF